MQQIQRRLSLLSYEGELLALVGCTSSLLDLPFFEQCRVERTLRIVDTIPFDYPLIIA